MSKLANIEYETERRRTEYFPLYDRSISEMRRIERFRDRVSKMLKEPHLVTLLFNLEDGTRWISHESCIESDYGGYGTIGAANFRFLAEKYPDAVQFTGYHAVRTPFIPLTSETIELINQLYDYPVLDEMTLAEYEHELCHESFDSWVRSDIRGTIGYTDENPLAELWDELPRDVAWQLLSEVMEESNIDWEPDGNSLNMTIPIDEIIEPLKIKLERELAAQDIASIGCAIE